MDMTAHSALAMTLARRFREARVELTTRWLERITARVSLDVNRIFPSDELLDHVPLLIDGVADYVEQPAHALAADMPVLAKAMELGAMRHAQGFDEYQILKEYELFGGVLFAFLTRTVDDLDEPCTPGELLACAHRVHHAVSLIQQATATQYIRLAKEQVKEREDRLRAFNRSLTHEFRNRIGATLGAGQLLELETLPPEARRTAAGVVVRNADGMRVVLDNLLELSRVEGEGDRRQKRHVRLRQAVAESARQLRDAAAAQGIEVRVADDLPDVEVNAAAVELCLTNFLSNAIKYADPQQPARWIEVRGRIVRMADDRPPEAVVEVRDNGLGVPEEKRGQLFDRFFRAHEHSATVVEGTGLGLSIVREAVQSLGGRVWAEFPTVGSVFVLAIPCRRAADAGGRDADAPAREGAPAPA